ncbi:hypothetical protein MNL76_05310 [Fervidobacterium riparium]|nr:hypothetical protein IB67_09100 [Fervidobacterium riparium]
MGNYIIEVDSEQIRQAIKKADKVCGTLEPSMRKLTFFAENEKLYLKASDGCFTGFFPLTTFFYKSLHPFEIPLDVVKQFVSELNGKLTLSFQDGILTLKSQNELLRLRMNFIQEEIKLPSFENKVVFQKKRILSELDFVSCFLEEGNYTDLFYAFDRLEIVSSHLGLIAYSKIENRPINEQSDGTGEKPERFSLSIPYVSTRHLLKALDTEETDSIELSYNPNSDKLLIYCGDVYTMCGDKPERTPDRIREVVRSIVPVARVYKEQIQRLLRRSLISGRFSDVEVYSRHDEIVVVSQQGSIAYKGSVSAEVNAEFSVKTKAYLLRSALNRIGSQYVVIGNSGEFTLFSSPSLSRFLILRNQRVQGV